VAALGGELLGRGHGRLRDLVGDMSENPVPRVRAVVRKSAARRTGAKPSSGAGATGEAEAGVMTRFEVLRWCVAECRRPVHVGPRPKEQACALARGSFGRGRKEFELTVATLTKADIEAVARSSGARTEKPSLGLRAGTLEHRQRKRVAQPPTPGRCGGGSARRRRTPMASRGGGLLNWQQSRQWPAGRQAGGFPRFKVKAAR